MECEINADCRGLASLRFQSEEANTDEEVKAFFKAYITSNNRLKASEVERLVINRGNSTLEVSMNDLAQFSISRVLLPSELTDEMRAEIAATKRSVYTNPDLYLQVNDGDSHIDYISVELKTTKTNQIPGSSIQQVNPSEWVIFVRHTDRGVIEVACGFYINSITERLPFPDRSPRPIIAFDTLKKWNRESRCVDNGTLRYTIDTEAEESRIKILNNWEQVLCDEWLETIQKRPHAAEKWFNNTIRMYTLQLLKRVKANPQLADELISSLSDSTTHSC
ncbi:MAG: hypothetical protein IJ348_00495 [Alistipes sp.]|nr:hypothetical protein [Alistipes sp.]